MLKILLKKQLYEINEGLFRNKRTGVMRSKMSVIGTISGFILLVLMLSSVFFYLAYKLLFAFMPQLTWLYFTFMCGIAIILGVFGSVFNTFSSLYKSNDNDLLLSLPITMKSIVLSRLFSVFIIGLLYSGMVTVPTTIVYYAFGSPSLLGVVFAFLLIIVIAVFVASLSCALGYIVVKISYKLKNKSLVIVLISLVFVAGYFWVYSKAFEYIEYLIQNGQIIAKNIKFYAFLFYAMGMMGAGDVFCALGFTIGVFLIALLVYAIMLKSFYKIVATKDSSKKGSYSSSGIKTRGLKKALLNREFKKLLSNSAYMLNCGMGVFFMPLIIAFLIIKGQTINGLIEQVAALKNAIAVIAFCVIAMSAATVDITAPSVSLEGKNLWIIKSLPVKAKDILQAKINLQCILTLPITLVLGVVVCTVVGITPSVAVLVVFAALCFAVCSAETGLILNLKMPNLKFTNEIYVIKQSASVAITLFGGWLAVIICGVGGYFLCSVIPASAVMGIVAALFLVLDILLKRYIDTKGVKLFENLN